MDDKKYREKASKYLNTICSVKPNRRTGSKGNKEATAYFANIIETFGYEIDTKPFDSLDYKMDKVSLSYEDKEFLVNVSPYSLGCDVLAEVVVVNTVEELEKITCKDKILLMQGEICKEQLMPKNFVFYNPENHKKIYALLEEKQPAAIITVTERNPELVGALYPFPLIVDGDFNIPSVYCTEIVGREIAACDGQNLKLMIYAKRIQSKANNVIARKNKKHEKKIVVCAHIDAYEDAPGASDNASGVTVLLLLAEMIMEYDNETCIEIIAINGEDHYSAGGEMDYLSRYGSEIENIMIAINIDDVGYKKGKTAFSFYECEDGLRQKLLSTLGNYQGLLEGQQWHNGDHMVFVQKGVSALAFTSENMMELMSTITHTDKDTVDIVEPSKLVEVAKAIADIIMNIT